ncbi:MAG: response regulator [Desulfobacterales bacterium]|nr:MAG: response regulator [Desulfobacterales bacterium]
MEKKILVVDDEDYHRELMQKLLSKLGYEVDAVESAEDAFSLLERNKFPVIITDLIMLEMDGVEFCRRIRETDDKTVVIALTGHTELYDIDKLKEAGFDNHLTKPFRIEIITQAIQEGFDEFQRRTEIQNQAI